MILTEGVWLKILRSRALRVKSNKDIYDYIILTIRASMDTISLHSQPDIIRGTILTSPRASLRKSDQSEGYQIRLLVIETLISLLYGFTPPISEACASEISSSITINNSLHADFFEEEISDYSDDASSSPGWKYFDMIDEEEPSSVQSIDSGIVVTEVSREKSSKHSKSLPSADTFRKKRPPTKSKHLSTILPYPLFSFICRWLISELVRLNDIIYCVSLQRCEYLCGLIVDVFHVLQGSVIAFSEDFFPLPRLPSSPFIFLKSPQRQDSIVTLINGINSILNSAHSLSLYIAHTLNESRVLSKFGAASRRKYFDKTLQAEHDKVLSQLCASFGMSQASMQRILELEKSKKNAGKSMKLESIYGIRSDTTPSSELKIDSNGSELSQYFPYQFISHSFSLFCALCESEFSSLMVLSSRRENPCFMPFDPKSIPIFSLYEKESKNRSEDSLPPSPNDVNYILSLMFQHGLLLPMCMCVSAVPKPLRISLLTLALLGDMCGASLCPLAEWDSWVIDSVQGWECPDLAVLVKECLHRWMEVMQGVEAKGEEQEEEEEEQEKDQEEERDEEKGEKNEKAEKKEKDEAKDEELSLGDSNQADIKEKGTNVQDSAVQFTTEDNDDESTRYESPHSPKHEEIHILTPHDNFKKTKDEEEGEEGKMIPAKKDGVNIFNDKETVNDETNDESTDEQQHISMHCIVQYITGFFNIEEHFPFLCSEMSSKFYSLLLQCERDLFASSFFDPMSCSDSLKEAQRSWKECKGACEWQRHTLMEQAKLSHSSHLHKSKKTKQSGWSDELESIYSYVCLMDTLLEVISTQNMLKRAIFSRVCEYVFDVCAYKGLEQAERPLCDPDIFPMIFPCHTDTDLEHLIQCSTDYIRSVSMCLPESTIFSILFPIPVFLSLSEGIKYDTEVLGTLNLCKDSPECMCFKCLTNKMVYCLDSLNLLYAFNQSLILTMRLPGEMDKRISFIQTYIDEISRLFGSEREAFYVIDILKRGLLISTHSSGIETKKTTVKIPKEGETSGSIPSIDISEGECYQQLGTDGYLSLDSWVECILLALSIHNISKNLEADSSQTGVKGDEESKSRSKDQSREEEEEEEANDEEIDDEEELYKILEEQERQEEIARSRKHCKSPFISLVFSVQQYSNPLPSGIVRHLFNSLLCLSTYSHSSFSKISIFPAILRLSPFFKVSPLALFNYMNANGEFQSRVSLPHSPSSPDTPSHSTDHVSRLGSSPKPKNMPLKSTKISLLPTQIPRLPRMNKLTFNSMPESTVYEFMYSLRDILTHSNPHMFIGNQSLVSSTLGSISNGQRVTNYEISKTFLKDGVVSWKHICAIIDSGTSLILKDHIHKDRELILHCHALKISTVLFVLKLTRFRHGISPIVLESETGASEPISSCLFSKRSGELALRESEARKAIQLACLYCFGILTSCSHLSEEYIQAYALVHVCFGALCCVDGLSDEDSKESLMKQLILCNVPSSIFSSSCITMLQTVSSLKCAPISCMSVPFHRENVEMLEKIKMKGGGDLLNDSRKVLDDPSFILSQEDKVRISCDDPLSTPLYSVENSWWNTNKMILNRIIYCNSCDYSSIHVLRGLSIDALLLLCILDASVVAIRDSHFKKQRNHTQGLSQCLWIYRFTHEVWRSLRPDICESLCFDGPHVLERAWLESPTIVFVSRSEISDYFSYKTSLIDKQIGGNSVSLPPLRKIVKEGQVLYCCILQVKKDPESLIGSVRSSIINGILQKYPSKLAYQINPESYQPHAFSRDSIVYGEVSSCDKKVIQVKFTRVADYYHELVDDQLPTPSFPPNSLPMVTGLLEYEHIQRKAIKRGEKKKEKNVIDIGTPVLCVVKRNVSKPQFLMKQELKRAKEWQKERDMFRQGGSKLMSKHQEPSPQGMVAQSDRLHSSQDETKDSHDDTHIKKAIKRGEKKKEKNVIDIGTPVLCVVKRNVSKPQFLMKQELKRAKEWQKERDMFRQGGSKLMSKHQEPSPQGMVAQSDRLHSSQDETKDSHDDTHIKFTFPECKSPFSSSSCFLLSRTISSFVMPPLMMPILASTIRGHGKKSSKILQCIPTKDEKKSHIGDHIMQEELGEGRNKRSVSNEKSHGSSSIVQQKWTDNVAFYSYNRLFSQMDVLREVICTKLLKDVEVKIPKEKEILEKKAVAPTKRDADIGVENPLKRNQHSRHHHSHIHGTINPPQHKIKQPSFPLDSVKVRIERGLEVLFYLDEEGNECYLTQEQYNNELQRFISENRSIWEEKKKFLDVQQGLRRTIASLAGGVSYGPSRLRTRYRYGQRNDSSDSVLTGEERVIDYGDSVMDDDSVVGNGAEKDTATQASCSTLDDISSSESDDDDSSLRSKPREGEYSYVYDYSESHSSPQKDRKENTQDEYQYQYSSSKSTQIPRPDPSKVAMKRTSGDPVLKDPSEKDFLHILDKMGDNLGFGISRKYDSYPSPRSSPQ
ncbi:hypothetical protein ADUPG1_010993, partial [Aduncisulcus paluster]